MRHLIITGQTRLSGKTTTLDAIVHRSGLRALTFLTKPGEDTFAGARPIRPYFHDQGGWRFVASVLEAAMGERLKQERSEIINASKGAESLQEVYNRIVAKKAKAKSGWVIDILTRLEAYLEIVLPQLKRTPFANSLELGDGVNLIDMSGPQYSDELRALIIRSALEWILKHEQGVMTVIPEAWQFIPNGRGNPVKQGCENLIRMGAVQNNWVGIDSQEVTAVDAGIRKSCGVWILGVQRELNEVKRVIDQLPGRPKPSVDEIMSLGLGQFFVSYTGAPTRKVYVQPAWMDEQQAQAIATGQAVMAISPPKNKPVVSQKTEITEAIRLEHERLEAQRLRRAPVALPAVQIEQEEEYEMASEDVKRLEQKLDFVIGKLEFAPTQSAPKREMDNGRNTPSIQQIQGEFDEEALFQRFKARLLKEPAVLKVLASNPEIIVQLDRQVIELDGSSLKGRVARLMAQGFIDEALKPGEIKKELERTGPSLHPARLSEVLSEFVRTGFLTSEDDGRRYQSVKDMKVNIVKRQAAAS